MLQSTQNLAQDAQVSSGQKQLKSFGAFLDRHDNLLRSLSGKLSNNQDDHFGSSLDEIQCTNLSYCPPVNLSYAPTTENISIFQIIESDNKILNKVLITFVQLCEEAVDLKKSAREYQMKLLHFEEQLCSYEESGQTEECLIQMSELLELLCTIQYLSQRYIMVARSILQQIGALFVCKGVNKSLDLQLTMQFQGIFNCLADIIAQLIIFDEILINPTFQNFWQTYKKAVHSISMNLDRFNQQQQQQQKYSEFEINALSSVLDNVEILFSGNLFQIFLDGTFKIKEEITITVIGEISGHFQDYIKVNLTSIDKFSSNLSEFEENELIVKINAICVLFHIFFGQLEQKVFKHLIEVNAKNIGITLVGNTVWRPEVFLHKHAQTLMKTYEKHLQDATRLRQMYLQSKIQTIAQESRQYCSSILSWSLQMDASLRADSHRFQVTHFKNLCNLFLQGLKSAGQLSHMIKSLANLHVLLHTKMSKQTLLSICKLIEYLKIVRSTFENNFANISKAIQCVLQYLMYKTLFIIGVIKKKLTSQGACNERNLDILSALQIAEKCLYGPPTKTRIQIAALAINLANPMGVLTPEYLQKLHRLLYRLDLLANLQTNIEHLCDPSFMYWHHSILSVYLKQSIDSTKPLSSPSHGNHATVKYLLRSADSCSESFRQLDIGRLQTIENFRAENYRQYRQEIAVKLCARIETFLRIQVHESLAQNKANPFTSGLEDCRDLVNFYPMEINGKHIVLRDHVENYLSNMFYNLTTISLHDWRTYAEMRHLGNYKFNLSTIEDHLPTQQLEQGIDVLEIMRNIHVFVSKYLYSMNNQIFIEYVSNNKHLNTIGIKHIANSLRTHGIGIINTTVNFTYQFLRKKLYTFSQFMFDEHIKSRLMKDLKYFRDNKDRLDQMYSFERADSFNKGIRKLGLTPDGQSYLDLFRKLISHVGNAMGYIRLMRSGGIHVTSNISVYLPKFEENLKFSQHASTDGLTEVTVKAAENLEENIRNLSRCFSDETEYFKLLIEAFAPFFRDPKNIHLRNFYLIVPPLTINFVEYIISAKDKIYKKDKQGVLFVDDGFAIGLVYILRLLNQVSEFNSLHWFKSIKQHYANERAKINAQRDQIAVSSAGDSKLQQTLALTEKRINAHQLEFSLLYYNLQSSKIFFQ